MPVDPAFVALLAAGMASGALVNAFAGFAFSPVAAAFLMAALPPATLIPTLMLCSVLVQLAGLVRLRTAVLAGRSDAMLLGGLLGVPIAVLLLSVLNAAAFRVGFGMFLAGYALVMLRRPAARPASARRAGQELAVGFVGGLVGGLTAMPGAVPVMYADHKGLAKGAQRAIVHPFILVMQLAAIAMLAATGQVTIEVVRLVGLSIPALALGAAIGWTLFGRLPDASFRRAVLVLLLVTGIGAAAGEEVKAAMSAKPAAAAALAR